MQTRRTGAAALFPLLPLLPLGALALLASACASPPSLVTGHARWVEPVSLPPTAVLEVKLVDISLADAPGVVLSREEMQGFGGPPVPFALAYEPDAIDDAHSYTVEASVRVAGALWFRNAIAPTVLTRGAGNSVDVLLDKVGPVGEVADATDPEGVVLATNARLESLERVEGSYESEGVFSRYTAWLDGDHPAFVEEQREGAALRSDVRFWFRHGTLVRFEEQRQGPGAAGDTTMRIDFWEHRFRDGAKTVGGAPSEPDEHEVRAAWRQGEDLLLRVSGAYRSSQAGSSQTGSSRTGGGQTGTSQTGGAQAGSSEAGSSQAAEPPSLTGP